MAPATSEPLCLRPMTYGDARYDAGRNAGLREAAALLRAAAAKLGGSQEACALRYGAHGIDTLAAWTGEP